MPARIKNPAQRRYYLRFFPTIAAYIALFTIADSTFRHHQLAAPAAITLALAPALAIVAGIIVVGLYLAEEQDEFQRMLIVRSFLWGMGITLAFTTVHGFLELFTPIQKFPLYAVYPFFWVVTGLAQGAHAFYYRGRNE